MSVTVRQYERGGWEVDIDHPVAERARHRERRLLRSSRSRRRQRWGEERERHCCSTGQPNAKKEVPTLEEFAPRFIDGYARANRQKPSGIAAKETILKHASGAVLGRRSSTRSRTRTCSG